MSAPVAIFISHRISGLKIWKRWNTLSQSFRRHIRRSPSEMRLNLIILILIEKNSYNVYTLSTCSQLKSNNTLLRPSRVNNFELRNSARHLRLYEGRITRQILIPAPPSQSHRVLCPLVLVTMPLLHIIPPSLHTHWAFSPQLWLLSPQLFVAVSLQLVHAVTFYPFAVIF